jgi:hypothetical protein
LLPRAASSASKSSFHDNLLAELVENAFFQREFGRPTGTLTLMRVRSAQWISMYGLDSEHRASPKRRNAPWPFGLSSVSESVAT